MLKKFGALFLVITFLLGCDHDISKKIDNTYLPSSIGGMDDVLVIIDQKDTNTCGVMTDWLQQPFPGIAQFEPMFHASVKGPENFSSLIAKHRNIIIVDILSEATSNTGSIIKKDLGEKFYMQKKKAGRLAVVRKKDVWASPQEVFVIFIPATGELLPHINNIKEKIEPIILDAIEKKALTEVYAMGKNPEMSKKIQTKFGIKMDIPQSYQVRLEEENLLWLGEEETDKSTNVVLYRTSQDDNVIKIRNEAGKYISSEAEGSAMMVDTLIPIHVSHQNGMIMTRGWWRMQHDFMGGAFVNRLIKQKEETIMIDGFIHAPKLKKKKHIRRLEAMVKSAIVTYE